MKIFIICDILYLFIINEMSVFDDESYLIIDQFRKGLLQTKNLQSTKKLFFNKHGNTFFKLQNCFSSIQ